MILSAHDIFRCVKAGIVAFSEQEYPCLILENDGPFLCCRDLPSPETIAELERHGWGRLDNGWKFLTRRFQEEV